MPVTRQSVHHAWAARAHWADRWYSRLSHSGALFADGFGAPGVFERLARDREDPSPAPRVRPHLSLRGAVLGAALRVGRFPSPCAELLPEGAREALFWELLPPRRPRAVVVHLAATGDEGPWTRLSRLAWPLAREGVASIILENPFYGARRPAGQRGHLLRTVADMAVMFRAAIEESRALLGWARARYRVPVVSSGTSMGAHAAALAAVTADEPPLAALFLGSASACPIFCEGVLSNSLAWPRLSAEAGSREAARQGLEERLSTADVEHFPPLARERAVLVNARADGYIPRTAAERLARWWDHPEQIWLSGGHVSTFVRGRAACVTATLRLLDNFTLAGARGAG